MDLPASGLPHRECTFRPCEPRVRAAARCRDGRAHTASFRIDLLDVILGNLKQVLAVEGRSCMRGDIDRAHRFSTLWVEGAQLVSGRKPHVLTVKRHTMHMVGFRITGRGGLSSRFAFRRHTVEPVPLKPQCTRSGRRLLTLRPSEEHEMLEVAREREAQPGLLKGVSAPRRH